MSSRRTRHILSLSGGKDSTALAIYLRDRIPELEYVFCDTEKELPETYAYLDRLEAYLGKPIVRLKHDGRGFDHWLVVYRGFLPSTQMRWCTKHLKIRPFEQYVGDDLVINFIGIRSDEDRLGYISTKPNIEPRFPFKEDGIDKARVMRILDESGLGLPEYYRWRSRSGCYFCFFQQKIEWVGLLDAHRDKFLEAMAYEKIGDDGQRYTWQQDESLEELSQPERIAQIRAEHQARIEREQIRRPNSTLMELFEGVTTNLLDAPCTICSL